MTAPHSAAIAGIAFAILFGLSMSLFQSGLPVEQPGTSAVDAGAVERITWAVRIVPFAGIAFLWFVGVLRQRLGAGEDRFVATVMLGSALLFTAMVFVAFAFVGGILAAAQSPSPGDYLVHQSISQQVFNVYALKMAAVFMSSLSLLWRRTGVMPKPLAMLTLLLAVVLLVSTSLNPWMVLVFPAWVLIVSIYLLAAGLPETNETAPHA